MNAPTTARLAALLLAIGLCGVGWSASAHACDLSEPPTGPNCPIEPPLEVGEVRAPVPHSSVVGTQLVLEGVEVRRSSYPPPGNGDCGELGGVSLKLRLHGFEAWPEDVGLQVQVASGSYFGSPAWGGTGWVWPSDEGVASLSAGDDPRVPMDATLILTAVDCAGAETDPIEARLIHPGRPDRPDAGVEGSNAEASFEPQSDELDSDDPSRESRSLGCSLPSLPNAPGRPPLALVSLLALALARRSASTCRSDN